jgi:hypothetical protein
MEVGTIVESRAVKARPAKSPEKKISFREGFWDFEKLIRRRNEIRMKNKPKISV